MSKSNALSVDLEFWLSRIMETAYFDHENADNSLVNTVFEETVIRPTERLMEIFSKFSIHATFFTTNSIFAAAPHLVEKIHQRGHEIAFHGFTHNDTASLSSQIESSHDFISRFHIKGFRAPEMRFSPENIDVLAQNGFTYDSSQYGGRPYTLTSENRQNKITEAPVSCHPADTIQTSFMSAIKHCRIPFGSGILLGIMPAYCISGLIRKLNGNSLPAILFVHQWQLVDRCKLMSLFNSIRKSNLSGLDNLKARDIYSLACVPGKRLEKLLSHHSFNRMDNLLNEHSE